MKEETIIQYMQRRKAERKQEKVIRQEKFNKDFKLFADGFSNSIVYIFFMVITGFNVFLFSNVVMQINSPYVMALLWGNFLVFGTFAYDYFKGFEKILEAKNGGICNKTKK